MQYNACISLLHCHVGNYNINIVLLLAAVRWDSTNEFFVINITRFFYFRDDKNLKNSTFVEFLSDISNSYIKFEGQSTVPGHLVIINEWFSSKEYSSTSTRSRVESRPWCERGVSRRNVQEIIRICYFRKSEARSRETRRAGSNADSPIPEAHSENAKIDATASGDRGKLIKKN